MLNQQNENPVPTDYQIRDQIDDTISQLKFYPDQYKTPILASGGWDGKLRAWNIGYQANNMNSAEIQSNLIFNTQLNDPVLSIAWRTSTPGLIAGCGDGSIHVVDLSTSQSTQIGKHESGAQGLCYIGENNANLLISGGWDSKLHIWDFRQQNPCFSYNLPKKVVSMSCTFPLMVVGMSDRILCYFNLQKLGQNFQPDITFESHLKYGTTVVTCFNEPNGYAIGSIEGRTAIKHVDLSKIPTLDTNKTLNFKDDFAFRCHRSGENNSQSEVYPVNSIAFNPIHGTFCTGGGDGTWLIWDKDSKTKLRPGATLNKSPITALEYSADGNLLAYANGYDWHKGYQFENSTKPEVRIHYLPDSEKKKKPKPIGNLGK